MRRRTIVRAILGVAIGAIGTASVVSAQAAGASGGERPWGRSLLVTDARLADALEFLATASPLAEAAIADLGRSRLPVAIGTPAQLAEISERQGGPTEEERTQLLAATTAPRDARHGGAVAWVMFRSEENDDEHWDGYVSHVWIAVEADSVETWIRDGGGENPEEQIRQDYLAILAHEFVAHIGSIARSRRMADLCDDPSPEQRERSNHARSMGEPEPVDGDLASCALRVENQVRREVNGALAAMGANLLPLRSSYSLEALNFERARRRLYPTPDFIPRRLVPIRN